MIIALTKLKFSTSLERDTPTPTPVVVEGKGATFDGNCWFDIGLKPSELYAVNNYLQTEMKMAVDTTATGDQTAYGSFLASGSTTIKWGIRVASKVLTVDIANNRLSVGSSITGTYTSLVTLDDKAYSYSFTDEDGEVKYSKNGTSTADLSALDYTLSIGRLHYTDTYMSGFKGTIYSGFKFNDGTNTYTYQFRSVDDVIKLYCVEKDEYYENQGTGTLTLITE